MYLSYSAENFLSTLLIICIAISFSNAATIPSPSSEIQREFTAEDLIVTGHDGRIEVISRKEYMAHVKNVSIATAAQHFNNYVKPEDEQSSPAVEKRCKRRTVFTMNPVETFLDWDVAMSPVVLAPLNETASVNIDKGHNVGESLSVSAKAGLIVVKKFMSSSFSINYDKSWTTDSSIKYTFKIPPGKFGAIVSNPLTTRHSGWVDVGCIGNSKRIEFSGDSYQSMALMQMAWVEGVIGLCISDTFPLKRCLGNGTL